MSASVLLAPLVVSLILTAAESIEEINKKIELAPKNDGTARITTRFNDKDLLKKTLVEHGVNVVEESENRLVAEFNDGRICYERASVNEPFVLMVSEIGDTQCMIDELTAIETEYNSNVQSYTYDRVMQNLPEDMHFESEEVLEDDSIVITLTVE